MWDHTGLTVKCLEKKPEQGKGEVWVTSGCKRVGRQSSKWIKKGQSHLTSLLVSTWPCPVPDPQSSSSASFLTLSWVRAPYSVRTRAWGVGAAAGV